MIVLGIESSCDETAVGIVRDGHELLANTVASSMDLHAQYGGVIPEIAARSHIEAIVPTIQTALDTAQLSWDDIDGIAVTQGAGLVGSLLVGTLAARTLSVTKNKPLYAVNHVEAHLYVNFLTQSRVNGVAARQSPPQFPLLGVIVSGGHSQLVLYRDHFNYTLLGQTHDDAIGEAYDKVAKLLGMPYPGGVNVSRLAELGDAQAYTLPKARLSGKYDFSFSGPKTAVLRLCQQLAGRDHTVPSHQVAALLTDQQKRDICASFARVASETIVDKVMLAVEEFSPRSVIIGGGVAANVQLRRNLADRLPFAVEYPDFALCGDNGAMVATVGCFKMLHSQPVANPYDFEVKPALSM